MRGSRVEIRGNLGKVEGVCVYIQLPVCLSVLCSPLFASARTPIPFLGSVLTESKCHVFAADKGEREPLLAGALLQLLLVAPCTGQTAIQRAPSYVFFNCGSHLSYHQVWTGHVALT
jgi:hypothetical protein